MILSHDEREIVNGCVALMHELTDRFIEWMEWQGVDCDEEERFDTSFTYFEIVQRLLLYHTNHSGGTSTREKCAQIGFDSWGEVEFADRRYDDEYQ